MFIRCLVIFQLNLLAIGCSGNSKELNPNHILLHAEAGYFKEKIEPVETEGYKKLTLNLHDLKNGTNWAPGIMITFYKGNYDNSLIFHLIQKEETDKYLTPGYRYALNGNDIFITDLDYKHDIGKPIDFEVRWDKNGVFQFSFGNIKPIRFKPEFRADKLVYSVSSGNGEIIIHDKSANK